MTLKKNLAGSGVIAALLLCGATAQAVPVIYDFTGTVCTYNPAPTGKSDLRQSTISLDRSCHCWNASLGLIDQILRQTSQQKSSGKIDVTAAPGLGVDRFELGLACVHGQLEPLSRLSQGNAREQLACEGGFGRGQAKGFFHDPSAGCVGPVRVENEQHATRHSAGKQ